MNLWYICNYISFFQQYLVNVIHINHLFGMDRSGITLANVGVDFGVIMHMTEELTIALTEDAAMGFFIQA